MTDADKKEIEQYLWDKYVRPIIFTTAVVGIGTVGAAAAVAWGAAKKAIETGVAAEATNEILAKKKIVETEYMPVFEKNSFPKRMETLEKAIKVEGDNVTITAPGSGSLHLFGSDNEIEIQQGAVLVNGSKLPYPQKPRNK